MWRSTGFHPWPIIFIMYVNDLPKCSSFSTKLYADDTYLCLAHSDIKELKLMVNNELIKVDEWIRLNKLCEFHVFSNGKII